MALPPSNASTVDGTVILRLPTAKKVKKLDVELVRRPDPPDDARAHGRPCSFF